MNVYNRVASHDMMQSQASPAHLELAIRVSAIEAGLLCNMEELLKRRKLDWRELAAAADLRERGLDGLQCPPLAHGVGREREGEEEGGPSCRGR